MNTDIETVTASVRPLTSKQEKFCELVASGSNLSEAYRAAYDAGEMKPATVNRKAKEVADNGKIAARIGELREAARKASIATREELLQRVTGIIRDSSYKPEVTLDAVRTLSKMEGFDAPERSEHVTVTITTKRTTAQMRRILNEEKTLFDWDADDAEIVQPAPPAQPKAIPET